MPSLYKRGNIWWCCIWYKGVPQYNTTHTGNKAEATRVMNRLALEIRGESIDKMFASWSESKLSVGENAITDRYRKDVKTYFDDFADFVNKKSANAVTHKDLIDYRTKLTEKNNETTIGIKLRSIKSVFTHSQKVGIIKKSPFDEFYIPRGNKRENYLGEYDIIQLLKAAEDRPLIQAYLEFAIKTGIRTSEITNLKWNDIEYDYIELNGKSGKRNFPVVPKVFNLIDRIGILQNDIEPLPEWFLVNEKGQYLGKHNGWTRIVKKYIRKANLSDELCAYHLRHTFVSQCLLHGMRMEDVSKLAGHKLISTTQTFYDHVEAKDLDIDIPF